MVRRRGTVFHLFAIFMKIHKTMKFMKGSEFQWISWDLWILRFQGAQKWVDSEPCPAPSRLKEINRGFPILNGN